MSRPLRIEFPGAVYHVTSRGDRREPIYIDDEDRQTQLAVLAQAMQRFGSGDRDSALHTAYCRHGLTMTALSQATGLSVSRVSRVIAAVEAAALG